MKVEEEGKKKLKNKTEESKKKAGEEEGKKKPKNKKEESKKKAEEEEGKKKLKEEEEGKKNAKKKEKAECRKSQPTLRTRLTPDDLTREEFFEHVCSAIEDTKASILVEQAIVSLEYHKPQNGGIVRPHYHCILSAGDSSRRFSYLRPTKYLRDKGIFVNWRALTFPSGFVILLPLI